MRRRLSCLWYILFIPALFACGNKDGLPTGEVLVKIDDRTLTRLEVETLIPKGLSSEDSFMRAESFVKKWIIDVLIDNAAYRNIGDDRTEIDRLVNEYRRTLLRHRYQERLIRDKVSANISETEQRKYYEQNQAQFILSENLIKGLFLKAPSNAPGLDKVRKWYASQTEEAIEQIEKYSLQNAIIYDYFYDRWVNFNEVMDKIPHRISEPVRFLQANRRLEVADSTHVYFLNISDKLLVGNVAPYEYVRTQILDMLANKRKLDYLREFGESLYHDAVKNGTVKWMTE